MAKLTWIRPCASLFLKKLAKPRNICRKRPKEAARRSRIKHILPKGGKTKRWVGYADRLVEIKLFARQVIELSDEPGLILG